MRMITVTYFDVDHQIICQKRHPISHSIEDADDAFGYCDTLDPGQYLLINAGFGQPVLFDHQGARI